MENFKNPRSGPPGPPQEEDRETQGSKKRFGSGSGRTSTEPPGVKTPIMAEPTWRIILFSLVASAMLSQKGKARLKKVERPPPFSNSLCLLTSANISR